MPREGINIHDACLYVYVQSTRMWVHICTQRCSLQEGYRVYLHYALLCHIIMSSTRGFCEMAHAVDFGIHDDDADDANDVCHIFAFGIVLRYKTRYTNTNTKRQPASIIPSLSQELQQMPPTAIRHSCMNYHSRACVRNAWAVRKLVETKRFRTNNQIVCKTITCVDA